MRRGWMRSEPVLALSFAMGACLSVPSVDQGATDGESESTTTSTASTTTVGTSTTTTTAGPTESTTGTDTSEGTGGQVEAIVLSAAAGTQLPAGATVEITAMVTPPESVMPGLVYSISTDLGVVRHGMTDAAAVDVIFDDSGMATFGLRVPVDVAPDSNVSLSADAIDLQGDTSFTIIDPAVVSLDDGGDLYEVADGFSLDSLLADQTDQNTLAGRASHVALPPAGSAFVPTLHIVSAGTPPDLYRLADDALEFVSTSPGSPDEGVSQIAFSDPNGPHGDRLFVCSASIGAGDGVTTIDFAGNWSDWYIFNNCNGLTIDLDESLDTTPEGDPVYINVSSDIVERVDSQMNPETILTNVPVGGSGYRLYINDQQPFETGLYLVFVGANDPAMDGAIFRTAPGLDGWTTPSAVVAGIGGPRTAEFTAGTDFGGLMYVYLQTDGELRGYRPDGSSFAFVRGLEGYVDLEVDVASNTMWIMEGGRGKLFSVTWN